MAGNTDRRSTPPPPPPPPPNVRVHRGSGMKARPPEAAGGRRGPAGRSGPASFSGPSSRTRTEGAAGAGLPVSGALGAALLAAAALLLLAPGEARALSECGSAITLPITCTDTSYPDGIFYGGSNDNHHPRGNGPINVAGSSTGPTTITATDTGMTTQQSVGIYVYGLGGSRQWNDLNVGVTVDSMGEMTDAGHVVNIVQGTSTNDAADRNNGIYFQHRSQMGDSTVRVGRGVTIGSETTPMQQNGIFYHPRGLSSWGGGKATLISAATIFAAKQGIRLFRNPSNVYHPTFRRTSHTTITNRGAISSGEEGVYLYFARPAGGATHLGDATITNTGAITVSGAHAGILMDYRGYGDTGIDNAGAVTAGGAGIVLSRTADDNPATVTNRGAVRGRGGHGISASYTMAYAGNGAIRVEVAEGASVTGSMAGVHVANAGTGLMVARKYTPGFARGEDPGDPEEEVPVTHGEGADEVALRNQRVTVRGAVTGGTEAAVLLGGGGGVLVLEGGEVRAGSSGLGIVAEDGPALVYIDGEVRGAAGGAAAVHLSGGGSVTVGLNGRVRANGAARAIRGADGAPVTVTVVIPDPVLYLEDVARVEGGYRNVESVSFRYPDGDGGYSESETLPVGADGLLDTSELPSRLCEKVEAGGDPRCRMYEALPSMLLALNALPSYAQRTSAARDANGGWARVEASGGEWRAKKAETAGKLAYDYRWFVGRAGVDYAPREDLRMGWSVHAPRGKAEMAGVGEVELDGVGAGVSATWLAGDLYVDAQAQVTHYDVALTSYTRGRLLEKDASGVGYALGVEGGKRMPVGEAFVTPRAGLSWSDADLQDFMDPETFGAPDGRRRSRVSVQDARSVKGRVGVMVEKEMEMGAASGRVFGSLDVEREFSDETEVQVRKKMLKTKVRPMAVSLDAGAVFDVRENVLLRAVAGYRTSGGGTSGYRGGLELQVRF